MEWNVADGRFLVGEGGGSSGQLPGAGVGQSAVLIMECKAVPCSAVSGSWLE
jgi:hypothetical protein